MVIGVSIAFPSGTEYFATKRFVYDGNQYIAKIVDGGISNLSENMSDEGLYETSGVQITFDDTDNHFRDILNDATNKYIYGVNVTIITESGTTIRQIFVEKWRLGTDVFILTASNKYGQIQQLLPNQVITSQEFPNAPNLSVGKVISTFVGSRLRHPVLDDPDIADQTRAYYVNGVGHYILAPTATTNIASITGVVDPDDTALAGATLSSSGGYYWINYSATGPFDYVGVFFNGSVNDVGDMVKDILDLFDKYTNSVTQFDSMTVATERYYQQNAAADAGNPNYYTHKLRKGKELLKEIADSFNAYYFVSSTKVITFKIFDYTSLTPDKTFQEGEILNYSVPEIDPNRMYNRIIINYAFSGKNNKLEKRIIHDHQASQERWGIKNTKEIDCPWLPWSTAEKLGTASDADALPYITAKYFGIENQSPYIEASFTMPIDKVIDNSLVANSLIKFPHSQGITTGSRLYQIKKINFNFLQDTANVEARDITEWEDFRTADKLLVHSNYTNNSKLMRNDAVGGNTTIGIQAASATNVEHSTAQKKWGSTSIRFPNTGIHDSLLAANSDHWDIITQTNFTIDAWCRFDGTGTTNYIMTHWEDASNYWRFYKNSSNQLSFQVRSAGSLIINMPGAGSLSANTWYFVSVIKVGNDYGIYLDTNQIAHTNDSDTDTFNGFLYVGSDGANSNYFVGYMDEIRLTHDNFFGAAPVAGLTDTITVPTGMYDDFGGYWNP